MKKRNISTCSTRNQMIEMTCVCVCVCVKRCQPVHLLQGVHQLPPHVWEQRRSVKRRWAADLLAFDVLESASPRLGDRVDAAAELLEERRVGEARAEQLETSAQTLDLAASPFTRSEPNRMD